jgi:hypothetical protein
MKHAVTASLAAILLAGCAGLTPAPREIDLSSIKPLVEFVERETGYSLRPLPRFVIDHEEMAMARGGSGPFAYVPYGMFAVLDGQPTVYLNPAQYDPHKPAVLSTLVHELVHHGQFLAYEAARAKGSGAETELRYRKKWECGRSVEREAYGVQIRWLRQNDPAGYHSMQSANVSYASACLFGSEKDLFASARRTIPGRQAAR